MPQIRVFALGGLDEIGKNCLVVEVEKDIFVFDCGMKILREIDLGINVLIPDFSYLLKKKNQIRGVFITKPDLGNAYALRFLLQKIPDLKIYMSALCQAIVTKFNYLSPAQIKDNLFLIDHTPLIFGKNKVHGFATATNLPGSLGFTLETTDNYLIYTGSYILEMDGDQTLFHTNLNHVLPTKKKPVLLMSSSVAQLDNPHFVTPHHKVTPWLKKMVEQTDKNLFLCCDQNDWYKIFTAIKTINQLYPDQFLISFWDERFGKNFIEIVNHHLPLFPIKNKIAFSTVTKQEQKRNLIFITGNQKWLFSRILQLVNSTNPDLILQKEDGVLILGENYFNSELSITNVLNTLHTKECQISFINNKSILPMEASQQDLKLLLSFFKPTYFFPINGYFQTLELAKKLNAPHLLKASDVLVRDNGEILTFAHNKHLANKYQFLEVNSVFVDNLLNSDVADSVIKERKILASEGCLVVSFAYQKKTSSYQLLSPIKVVTFGLASDPQLLKELESKICEHLHLLLKNNDKMLGDKELLVTNLKKKFGKIVKKVVNKIPLIFSIVFTK